MNQRLTIGVITSRPEPHLDWVFDSLALQEYRDIIKQIVVVDYYAQACDDWTEADVDRRHLQVFKAADNAGFAHILDWLPPMPNPWGGPARLTKVPWWHVSACRNTFLCMATGDYAVCSDDRCVLVPTWLAAIQDAIDGGYAIAGAYKKYWNMRVERGVVVDPGQETGVDNRLALANGKPMKCSGSWMYGFSGYPLEWALQVNGFNMLLDGMGFEDVNFGLNLQNNGFPMYYDPRMLAIEDRTPGEIGRAFRREDKGPVGTIHDKSHATLTRFGTKKRADNPWDIREVRERVLRGEPFPGVEVYPTTDWFDGQEISTFDSI